MIARATFDASTGLASISGITTNDQIIVPNSTGGKVNQGPYKSDNQAYSNTSTTFTLNGQTYDVVYGKVVKGVVQQFDFSGTSTNGGLTSPNCVETGKATIS